MGFQVEALLVLLVVVVVLDAVDDDCPAAAVYKDVVVVVGIDVEEAPFVSATEIFPGRAPFGLDNALILAKRAAQEFPRDADILTALGNVHDLRDEAGLVCHALLTNRIDDHLLELVG